MTTTNAPTAVLPCTACGKLNRVDLSRAEAQPKCGTCKMMAPVFADFAKRQRGQAIVAKVDTDRNPGVAARFAIRSIPPISAR